VEVLVGSLYVGVIFMSRVEYHQAYYASHAEEAKDKARARYALKSEEVKASRHRAYGADPERFKLKAKAWRSSNPDRVKANGEQWRDSNTSKILLGSARRRAKARGLDFNLVLADIVIPETCPALGLTLCRDAGDASPTLDRIDPKKGYVRGNVQVISMKANRIKNDATVEELKLILAFMGRTS
jgi:hypothetical protein